MTHFGHVGKCDKLVYREPRYFPTLSNKSLLSMNVKNYYKMTKPNDGINDDGIKSASLRVCGVHVPCRTNSPALPNH